MSLEQALADNTAALNALIGVWSKLNAQAAHIDAVATGDTVVAAGKPVAAKPEKAVAKQEPKTDPKPQAAVARSEPEAPAASTASSSEPSASVDYPTLQKAVFALAGKSREAAAAVAASMGVKTFKELGQDKWAEALGAVTEKLADLESA